MKPSRAASASRRVRAVTLRTSPESPTSPIAIRPLGRAISLTLLAIASAIARSVAGSRRRTPPTVATKQSEVASFRPARRSSTPSIMAIRAESRPLVTRRGCGALDGAISACTSVTSGRRPSTVTVTQVPGAGSWRSPRNKPLGSASPMMPSSTSSKQPISSAGPKRFLTARTNRKVLCLSPSK